MFGKINSSKGKVVLVTGANRGIGLAIVRGLLTKGCEVILAARSKEKAELAARQIDQKSGKLHTLALDVTDDQSIDQAFGQLSSQISHLDSLINNAGIYPERDLGVDIMTVKREHLMQTYDANTVGPIRVTQAALPLLEKSQDARVIHISSGYGELQTLEVTAPCYSLSKLALNGVTLLQNKVLSDKGISVFMMCPGWVRTDMGGEEAPTSPEDGADTAIWLATNAPRKHSGQFLRKRKSVSWNKL